MSDDFDVRTDLPELTCKELVELVTDYVEGALSAADRLRFDEHLGNCPFCTTYVDQMRQTIALVGRLPDAAMSPKALDALRAAFRDYRKV